MSKKYVGTGKDSMLTGSQKTKLFSFMFLLPSLLFVILIVFYPLFKGISYSFTDGDMFHTGSFVGLRNYITVLKSPDFLSALRFSVVFAFFSVLSSYLIGLGLALLLNTEIPARGFFRATILMPWIIPSVVSVVAWRWILGDQQSIANAILGFFGIEPVLFLASPVWATFSVILVKVWKSFPFMMVSILAVLQTIPEEQYESAKLDGAGSWQTFRYITFPNLKNITLVCFILMTIWSVNDFDTIFLLTKGGPFGSTQNIINLAYTYAFTKNDISAGSTMAIIAMVIMMVLAHFQLKAQQADE